MSSRNKGKAKAASTQKRTSALLDPEEELLKRQTTTEVQLINLSEDGRSRRIRTKVDVVPTATRPLHVPLFDFPYDEDDPNFSSPPEITSSFNTSFFDDTDVFLLPPQDSEIPGLTLKTSQRNKRYLNSVRLFFCPLML